MFKHAFVRTPPSSLGNGLTTANLGTPDHARALSQHAAYCEALERCGLVVTRLDDDPRYPDSTFVEDTAILTPSCAILTRPGAPSRAGEVSAIRLALSGFYSRFEGIVDPGILDGGDVCEADGHIFIGVSQRSNEHGARQLAAILEKYGYTSSCIQIRDMEGILHLKSGFAYVGDRRIVAIPALARLSELRNYEVVPVDEMESYAANCVRVNDRVLVAAGYPKVERALRALGYDLISLEMSEFQKMDGGLSCLSLRF